MNFLLFSDKKAIQTQYKNCKTIKKIKKGQLTQSVALLARVVAPAWQQSLVRVKLDRRNFLC